jgi:hypothetical protein
MPERTAKNVFARSRWVCTAVAGVVLALVVVLGVPISPKAQEMCSILESCSGINGLPTASQCEKDDCSCAQQIECHLRHRDPASNWPKVPGGGTKLNHNFFHDRFIETRISPKALKYWKRFSKNPDDVAEMPDGTIVFKSGYLPKDNNVARPDKPAASSYVFVKINGYCPDGSSVGDFCLGGDWFSLEIANEDYGILAAGTLVDEGKASKCFGCHAAAENGDWLWQLYSNRRYP